MTVKNGSPDKLDERLSEFKKKEISEEAIEELLADVKGTFNFFETKEAYRSKPTVK